MPYQRRGMIGRAADFQAFSEIGIERQDRLVLSNHALAGWRNGLLLDIAGLTP
ncbi:Hypothetical protein BROD_2377 [Brucella sp. NF 2653]|nr:Hypothetical protein BROD_2377 [Brucella sp. NF 2653]